MEREKYQYIEKAKYIQEQLVNFKTEIEDMKVSNFIATSAFSLPPFRGLEIGKLFFFVGGRMDFFFLLLVLNPSFR